MNAEEISRALGGRRSGKGWVAKCPAHQDKRPSLAIDEGSNGKVLVVCRAGCSQADLIDTLRQRGLWPEPHTASLVHAHGAGPKAINALARPRNTALPASDAKTPSP